MNACKLIVGAAVALLAAPAAAQTIAIEGGTVHTMAGAPIPNATVLIRDGRIVAVGQNVAVPAGAQRVDARGKVVTPGLIDSGTTLGLVEVSAVDETVDYLVGQQEEDKVAAAFNVADGLNPNSILIPITRVAGVTTAVSRPAGGLIAGQAVVIDLAGRDMEAMLVRNPVAMFADLSESVRRATGNMSRGRTILLLREILDDARAYARNRAGFERGETREFAVSRSDLEALQPVLAGRLPLVVEAHRASDIQTVLRLAREYNFRPVIYGGTEAWMVAQDLAAARVPVIVKVLQNLPESFEKLGATFENAARLRRAGVTVAITSGESFKSFNLRQEAGNAVANGLPHEEALRALTAVPAQLWGLEDYGTLAPGKVANVVVWGGDPLEMLTPVSNVFIRGQPVPLVSRETELRDRYLRIDDVRRAYPGR